MKAHERAWEYAQVQAEDDDSIVGLVDGARWFHQHLDWSTLESLIGRKPFMLATDEGLPVACLAAPPDSSEVAWIRLFAVASGYDLESSWLELWRHLRPRLGRPEGITVAALCLLPWLPGLLEKSGYQQSDAVIHLELPIQRPVDTTSLDHQPRVMGESELEEVALVDREAFAPIWRHSLEVLRLAHSQADYSTVIRADSVAIGYQISTVSAHGGHLARLAVLPDWQGQGIATALVLDASNHFFVRGVPRLTVNTQASNRRSQRLYRHLGFQRTGQSFPVYETLLTRA